MGSSMAVNASEVTEDYLDIASNYCVSGNYATALQYIDKILAIEPGNKDVIFLRNSLRRIQSGNSTAYATANNIKLKEAQNYKKLGNKSKEFENLNIAANTGSYWANMFLGDYYRNNREYSKAILPYKKALDASPKSGEPLLMLGTCLFEMRNYNDALPLLTRYIALNQQEAYSYAIRARVFNALARYNDAETDIITAIALEDNIEYRFLEGEILYRRGNYRKAKAALEKIAPEIQTSDVYKYIGLSDYALGDLNSALISLDKAIILSNDDKNLLDKYNEIKSKIGVNSLNIGN